MALVQQSLVEIMASVTERNPRNFGRTKPTAVMVIGIIFFSVIEHFLVLYDLFSEF